MWKYCVLPAVSVRCYLAAGLNGSANKGCKTRFSCDLSSLSRNWLWSAYRIAHCWCKCLFMPSALPFRLECTETSWPDVGNWAVCSRHQQPRAGPGYRILLPPFSSLVHVLSHLLFFFTFSFFLFSFALSVFFFRPSLPFLPLYSSPFPDRRS